MRKLTFLKLLMTICILFSANKNAGAQCIVAENVECQPGVFLSVCISNITIVSGYGCNDGSITVTATYSDAAYPNCILYIDSDWANPVNAPSGVPVTINNLSGATNHNLYVSGGPSCGYAVSFNNIPACSLSASGMGTPASGFGCNDGSLTITAITNACSGYYASIDGYGNIGAASSGQPVVLDNLYAGTYTAHIYAGDCEEIKTFTIAQPGCRSPYSIAAIPASGLGCTDGNINLTNNATCSNWNSQLYQNDPGNLIYSFNNAVAGVQASVISLDNYTGGLTPGNYYLKSAVSFTNFAGQSFACEVWDTITIGPACQFTSGVSGIIYDNCAGSFNVSAITNDCLGYVAEVNTLAGNYVGIQFGNNGDTLNFSNLLFGGYVVHTFPISSGVERSCERYDTIAVSASACSSPYTVSGLNASGYGCADGDIILTNNSACIWYSELYQFDKTNNIFSFFNYDASMGSSMALSTLFQGLQPGTYYIKSTNSVTNYDGQMLECEVWDSIDIGPPCVLTINNYIASNGSNADCTGGSITVNATTNDCNGYTVNIINEMNHAIVAGSLNNISGQSSTFDSLPAGNYHVEIGGGSPNSCNWSSPLVTVSCSVNWTTALTSQCAGSTLYSLTGGIPVGGTYSGPGVSGNNFNASLAGPGVHTLYYSYVDVNGASIVASNSINVYETPAVSFTGLAPAYCTTNAAVNLTGSPAGGIFSGPGIIGNSFNPAMLGTGGLYTVAYAYTNENGCPANSTQEVIITVCDPCNVTGSATTTPASCFGSNNGTATITLTGSGSGARGAGSYTVDGGTALEYNSNSFTITNLAAGNHTVIAFTAGGCISSSIAVNIAEPVTFTATYSKTNKTSCNIGNDGTITVTPEGGTGPYNYSWTGTLTGGGTYTGPNSGSITGLGYGFYAVTITDAGGCGVVALDNIHIENAYAVYVTNNGLVSSACVNNGSILLYGNAGVRPYTYSLDGTTYQVSYVFTDLAPGIYTAYVKDAGGCISTKLVSVGVAAPVVVTSFARGSGSCNPDGSVELFRTGGIGPYTYSLDNITYQASNKFLNLAAGTYTGYVKDSKGCIGTQENIIITLGAPLSVTAGKSNTSVCVMDGSVQLRVTGGVSPYTYSLDNINYQSGNSFTGLGEGTYTGYVKDSKGCIGSINVSIGQNPVVVVAQAQSASSCIATDGSITLYRGSGGTGPYTYSIDGNTYQSSNVFSNLPAGTYAGYIKDSKTCVGVKMGIGVTPAGCQGPVAITKNTRDAGDKGTAQFVNSHLSINAFPNPSLSEFTLLVQGFDPGGKVSVTVTDLMGRKVFEAKGNSKQQYRFGRNFIAGIYHVEVIQGTEKQGVKLVKK